MWPWRTFNEVFHIQPHQDHWDGSWQGGRPARQQAGPGWPLSAHAPFRPGDANALPDRGIYLIADQTDVIYVGRAHGETILTRLIKHATKIGAWNANLYYPLAFRAYATERQQGTPKAHGARLLNGLQFSAIPTPPEVGRAQQEGMEEYVRLRVTQIQGHWPRLNSQVVPTPFEFNWEAPKAV